MTTTGVQQGTTYDVEGRLLEVCNCDAVCPCWVGLDPDHGTCDSIIAWAVDRGQVEGVDVSDRVLGLSVHIPGNVPRTGGSAIGGSRPASRRRSPSASCR